MSSTARIAALAAAAALAPAGTALAHATKPPTKPLVVRGQDTVVDGPCSGGVCRLRIAGGAFRGTPIGTGAYAGAIRLRVARAFPNGEGGVCAPVRGRITFGTATPDRLTIALAGTSCQDGAGDPTKSSFTTLTRFRVAHGTGRWAGATGRGLAVLAEDADDHDRLTLTGSVTR
jgi:hypothetical protein